MRRFAWIILLLISTSASLNAQDDEIDSSKVFTSLDRALINPEVVFHLDLSRSRIKEFPVDIFRLDNLLSLNLSKNKLKTLPDLKELDGLEELNIAKNKFTEFPVTITQIKSLKKLDIGGNEIVDIPEEITALENLETWSAWGNEFSEIPSYLKEMQHLKTVDFRAMLFSWTEQDSIYSYFPNTEVQMDKGCDCD